VLNVVVHIQNLVVHIQNSKLERVLTNIPKIKLYVNNVTICKIASTHPAYIAPYCKTTL
jgi:hypothetical protein